ncbi:type II secretion system major pseudopilin GspG [Arcobacter sp.]|uniref:type II secretion system major pseudopilin GspG n=1 Tax=Arcobacter sp. TaxID=1872629 RepID=UPI003D10534A
MFVKKAFSLMELMVVIIILGLLAMFVLPNLVGKSEEAKEKLTCIQMKSVGQVLKMYKIDTSSYPSTEEKLDILVQNKYFEDSKMPKDSWDNPFVYISNEDGKSFELISFGPDKKEGGNDDIYYSKCNQ